MNIKNSNDLLWAIRKLNPGVEVYDDEVLNEFVLDGCSHPISTLKLPDGFVLNKDRRIISNGAVVLHIFKGTI